VTIYVVDLVTGSKEAPLDTLPGDQFAAVWLPGDTLIAFLARAATGYEVFTARPDGSDVRQRTQLGQSIPPFFDATPEGNLLLELHGTNTSDLFETTLTGDTIRRLTTTPGYEAFVAVSPDGATVAYVAGDGDFSHVWLRDRDGSNPRRLLPDRWRLSGSPPYFAIAPATSHSPSWTPDSRFVLLAWTGDPHLRADGASYDSGSEIYAIRVTDGLAIRLTRSPRVDVQPFFR
jgi:Tol biopolymer transport system component